MSREESRGFIYLQTGYMRGPACSLGSRTERMNDDYLSGGRDLSYCNE